MPCAHGKRQAYDTEGVICLIRAEDAIDTARKLIGTPYAQMDCISLIIQVIRRSPGGVIDYRCEGTNWLWDSEQNSGKYRHLVSRQEGISGAKAGMLAFKRYGLADEGHIGLVTGKGTVIHSSSAGGRGVVETPLTAAQGWDLLGKHRYIETGEGDRTMEMICRAKVATKNDPLSLREAPEDGRVIARMPKGAVVEVLSEGEWPLVFYDGMKGYASHEYLERIEEERMQEMRMVLTDDMGNTWIPEGGFSVQMRRTED